jgi:ribonucleases P/MRP protein subunit RPP40
VLALWLMQYSNYMSEPVIDPLKRHFPVTVNCATEISKQIEVYLPRLVPPDGHKDIYEDSFADFSVELYEWISLLSLESPRVDPNDSIDPFLSRYAPPIAKDQNLDVTKLVKISWHGFAASCWAHKIFVQAFLAAKPRMWFTFSVFGFNDCSRTGGGDCTIWKLPGAQNEYMLWEIEQG